MLQKILLAIMALLITGGAIMAYSAYSLADVAVEKALKKQEPQFLQYMQMNESDQTKFIIDNCDKILSDVMVLQWNEKDKNNILPEGDDKILSLLAENEKTMNLIKDTTGNSAVQKTFIDFGRSCMAKLIMHSDTLTKNMDAETKAKYQKESAELNMHFEQYCKVLDAAEANLNVAQ